MHYSKRICNTLTHILLGARSTSEISPQGSHRIDLLVRCLQRLMWNMQAHQLGINCRRLHPPFGPATHSLVPSLCYAEIPWQHDNLSCHRLLTDQLKLIEGGKCRLCLLMWQINYQVLIMFFVDKYSISWQSMSVGFRFKRKETVIAVVNKFSSQQ